MNWLINIIYMAVICFVRVCKWIELKILRLFTPIVKKFTYKFTGSLGIVLHHEDDDKLSANLKNSEVQMVEKGGQEYDRIIHFKTRHTKGYASIACGGTLGIGETYMDGLWDVYDNNFEDITEGARRALVKNLLDMYYHPWNRFLEWLELYAFNLQRGYKTFEIAQRHYDIGNDLFELMLDPWMQYTCGYWKDADNLSEAQINKMELIARKLELKPGMRVLDIGCGWGTLCKYLSEKYQVECVGITVSKEGVALGNKLCAGLPIEIRLQDYRDVNEKFDRIVSVGMFEHVGSHNFREYFEVAKKCLVDDGIFLLHTIGRNHYKYPQRSDPWSSKYIFPNGQVPSPIDIAETTKELFVIEDWHNFGQDYAKTLFCWRENFVKGWPKIEDKYGDRFFRMWILYLSLARALFLSRRLQVWQIVFSKDGFKRDYRSVR